MEVYVESQSQFHPHQFDRYRVKVGKTQTRRPKWSCAARTDWTVIGHPELTVEVTQDIDGNLVIRVI